MKFLIWFLSLIFNKNICHEQKRRFFNEITEGYKTKGDLFFGERSVNVKYLVRKDETLTQLGIGEAFISVLNGKYCPIPLAATRMRAPMSRMDVLTKRELKQLVENSKLYYKYNEAIDRNSAFEILSKKIERIHEKEEVEYRKKQVLKTRSKSSSRKSTRINLILKVVTSATFIRGGIRYFEKSIINCYFLLNKIRLETLKVKLLYKLNCLCQ